MTGQTIDISIIIPTLNGVGRIEKCLKSIFDQDYPRKKYEIIVVDDESDDGTIEICRSYGVDKVLISGFRDIEMSKALGIRKSIGKYILFIDDDNRLVESSWLSKGIAILDEDLEIGGVESAYFSYKKSDPVANRYCSLMGTNDPLVYYLQRTDRLAYFEASWSKPCKEFRSNKNHMKLRFFESQIPTLGSQGFLTRQSLISEFKFQDRFLHMDYCLHVGKGLSPYFAMTLDSVEHDHCTSLRQFVKKCRRNGKIYLSDGNTRSYSYGLTLSKQMKLAVIALTLVIPIKDSFRGYRKVKDIAWFLHPLFTVWVFCVYSKMYLCNRLALLNRFN
jgi:glycosyltransferase involved in cell wall biosynthesis